MARSTLMFLVLCACGPSEPAWTYDVPEPEPFPVPAVSSQSRTVGINLASAFYWSDAWPFVNVQRAMDAFHSGTVDEWNDGRALQTNAEGWVTRLESDQLARAIVFGEDTHHPTGLLTITHQGSGTLSYEGDVLDERRTPAADYITVGPGQFTLAVIATDADDPLRDIQVLPAGGHCAGHLDRACVSSETCRCVLFTSPPSPLFMPTFLEELRPFGVLRFMDWCDTNREVQETGTAPRAPIVDTADWPTTASASWNPVPWSVMTALADQTEADPWFNIPHQASDGLIRDFARAVKQDLEPDRHVYIEYSNEHWNSGFAQHHWINQQGCLRFSDAADEECNTGAEHLCGPSDWSEAQETCVAYGRRFFATRTLQIGRIWREELGEARVSVVLGAQIGSADVWVPAMLELQVGGESVASQVDAVAIAPYFGGAEPLNSSEQIFEQHEGVYRVLSGSRERDGEVGPHRYIQRDLERLSALRQTYPELAYIAYEGGQHLHSYDQASMAQALRANADPRMFGLYLQYLEMWHAQTDGALFVAFNSPSAWGQSGAWGSKTYQGQPLAESPKHAALTAYAHHHR